MLSLPGNWQAQTSLETQPLQGDKSLDAQSGCDQLSVLQVTNKGEQPLWLRLDSSGLSKQRPCAGK
ncbi:Uncharacterised protein [Kluyvera cryocrescens]|uniref:A2MG CUB domain-containing protein n=1 Tax=Kluyvera cryocrescens TaxID=580 RepID=A0A485ATJ7_KLUCR|nr:Uncharacterised protein [Kluyvera cryocrescens]